MSASEYVAVKNSVYSLKKVDFETINEILSFREKLSTDKLQRK